MCLAVIALGAHARLPLLIAANRDEFHERAALPAHWWNDGILAGRDAVGGGTWFGITRGGRWALVTNFREGTPRDPAAPSRGALVTMALRSSEAPLVCAARIASDGARYHGFNLLVGDAAASCAYASNRASGARALGPGVFGLSNHLLETPWPKVVRAKARLAAVLANAGGPAIARRRRHARRWRRPDRRRLRAARRSKRSQHRLAAIDRRVAAVGAPAFAGVHRESHLWNALLDGACGRRRWRRAVRGTKLRCLGKHDRRRGLRVPHRARRCRRPRLAAASLRSRARAPWRGEGCPRRRIRRPPLRSRGARKSAAHASAR